MALTLTATPDYGLAAVRLKVTVSPVDTILLTRRDDNGTNPVRLHPSQIVAPDGTLTVTDYEPALTGLVIYTAYAVTAEVSVTAALTLSGSESLTVPFAGYTLPVTLTRTGGTYGASINHEAMHRRTGGVTKYVDPVAGNNANDGLTWATAKKDPGNATFDRGRYNVAEIVLRGGVYTRAQSTLPVGVSGGRSDIVIRAELGTRPVFTQCDTSTAWTVHTGAAYKVSLSGPNIVFDLTAPKDADGLPIPLVPVADAATVAATPGSCYNSGSVQYVRLFDGRVPGTSVLVSRNTYNLNTTGADPVAPFSVLLEGIEFWGGLYARVKGWRAGDQLLAKDCAWRFAKENGLGIQAVDTVLIDCAATANGIDGFNYHDIDGRSGQALEINCSGVGNGRTAGGSSQNGSTAHDTYKIVRVGGVYKDNPGPNVADVGGVLSANYGVTASNALGYGATPDYDFTAPELGGALWLIGCSSSSSLALRNGAAAKVYNFARTGAIDGGVPATYVPPTGPSPNKLPRLASVQYPAARAMLDYVTGYDSARESRNTVHRIVGRDDPIVVLGSLRTREGQLETRHRSLASALAVARALSAGGTVLFRQADYPGLDMYLIASRIRTTPLEEARDGRHWQTVANYVEVRTPELPLLRGLP